jgi:hypothetical protein
MENNPEDPNSPENQDKIQKFLSDGLEIRRGIELQVHREVLCSLLAKEPSILQGKEPSDYIESKVRERLHAMLADASDISPSAASALARMLMPEKDQPPPTHD